jgi:esterase/lipase superfamily enzyme
MQAIFARRFVLNGKYYKEPSKALDRDMEYKVFGEAGKICLLFPPSDCRFYDYEDHGMIDALAPFIEAGKLQAVCVDAVDDETWFAQGDVHSRMELQERYFAYITEELLPTLKKRNGAYPMAMTAGCSMGAFHAANFFFRRPDYFDKALCLSGVYTADHFIPGYDDELAYMNSPFDFLSGMAEDHEAMGYYRDADLAFCVGGAEDASMIEGAHAMERLLGEKGIEAWFDYWGDDVTHDWPWWDQQLPYFMDEALKNLPAPAKRPAAKKAAPAKKAAAEARACSQACRCPQGRASQEAGRCPQACRCPQARREAKPAAAPKAAPAAKPKPAAKKAEPAKKPAAAPKPAAKPAAKPEPLPRRPPAAKPAAAAKKPAPAAKPAAPKAAAKPAAAKPAAKKAAPAAKPAAAKPAATTKKAAPKPAAPKAAAKPAAGKAAPKKK